MPTKTVIAIPPSFRINGELETESTVEYLNYLTKNNATTVMTTAGTSQFNLLTNKEIHKINFVVSNSFNGNKILGIPPVSTQEAIQFVKEASHYLDDTTHLMALYPDRYYSDDLIKEYIHSIRNNTDRPVYLHGMVMRSGYGGSWNFNSDVLCDLYEDKSLVGIKEEHSEFKKSYNFVKDLPKQLDVIVAGGSMRRHQYLHSAGANSFLSGIGNIFPQIEIDYCTAIDTSKDTAHYLRLEAKLFDVFMKNGWHQSLRIALDIMGLTCRTDRSPWPKRKKHVVKEIKKVIEEIKNER